MIQKTAKEYAVLHGKIPQYVTKLLRSISAMEKSPNEINRLRIATIKARHFSNVETIEKKGGKWILTLRPLQKQN